MVFLTILSGPFAGRTRNVSKMDPAEMLHAAILHGWQWSINYSHATLQEAAEWGKHDLACRCVLALSQGRPVFFLGKEYKVASKQEAERMAGKLEDDIVASGRNVSIDSDDERGVVVGVYGWEQ